MVTHSVGETLPQRTFHWIVVTELVIFITNQTGQQPMPYSVAVIGAIIRMPVPLLRLWSTPRRVSGLLLGSAVPGSHEFL